MQVSGNYIIFIILCLTAVFLLVGFYIVVQVINYARKKRQYEAEKNKMNQLFEQQLVQTKLEVQEQTLQNFSADLHDNIGQLLSLTNVTLASINVNDTIKTAAKIQSAQELIKRAIKEIRVLSKIYQDNLNAKAKPQSLTAGLTKGLFYVFVFSIAVYAVMFSINIIMEGMAISSFHSASGLISTYITHTSYHIAPVTNSTANTIANATKP